MITERVFEIACMLFAAVALALLAHAFFTGKRPFAVGADSARIQISFFLSVICGLVSSCLTGDQWGITLSVVAIVLGVIYWALPVMTWILDNLAEYLDKKAQERRFPPKA